MPTILVMNGWRFFFYANERGEPPHIHCKKGDADAKFWLLKDQFDVQEAHSYQLSPADRRFLRQTLFTHFDYLLEEWYAFQGGKP